MPYQTVSTRNPFHHGRIDDFVTYNYDSRVDLIADHEIVVHVRFIIQVWAQSECRTIGINFGDPPEDNFIEMPFVGVYRL
jgi:hypothetical protein